MITLQAVHKQFGAKILFNSITAALNPVQRIGLIGPNGAGKTMLIRMIVGEESPDSGSLSRPQDLRIGYLAQELHVENETTPMGYILEPFQHLLHHEEAAARLSSHTDQAAFEQAARDYARLQAQQAAVDIFSLSARARQLLAGLGVPENTWEQSIHNLPGGFRMRVALVRLLLSEPDFLLLDEPTNHLDMDSLIWLEKFLQRFNGGMLIISHDRDFLNRVTNQTAELNNGHLTQYSGNVDDFYLWRREHVATEQRRMKNITDQINQTKAFIERFKSKNTKATQAKSKMKQLERLESELPDIPDLTQSGIRLRLPSPPRSGAVTLTMRDLTAGYDGYTVFDRLNLTVNRGDKIAIIGPNGSGKSTLLKICARMLSPCAGEIEAGHNTLIRYFSQHRLDQLHPQDTLYDTIAHACGSGRKEEIMTILGAFLFSGDDALKTVSVLSGGEKSRLSLAVILADPGNVLLLDEPTNHLDIQSVERLASSLADFEGTLLIVSHDEYFISRVANRVIEIRPGRVRDFPGTLADYRAYIEAGFIEDLANSDTPAGTHRGATEKSNEKEERMRRREDRKKLERRLEKLERQIAETESQLSELNTVLHAPHNAHDYQLLAQTSRSITAATAQADEQMTQWTALQEELEKLSVD